MKIGEFMTSVLTAGEFNCECIGSAKFVRFGEGESRRFRMSKLKSLVSDSLGLLVSVIKV